MLMRYPLGMPSRLLTKPPSPHDCWTWTVELDGTADECRFRVLRDGALLLSGNIAALDGATTAELHDHRMGETPHDVAELHDAWQYALAEARQLMLALDGQVSWRPHPDPRGGMGGAP
jgi:hypothetical protein